MGVVHWGILSTARIGARLVEGAARTDAAEIVAVGSRDGATAQAFADAYDIPRAHGSYAALLDDPDDDVFGLAPGLEARYALPFGTPMAVVGNIFYAPDILTFGDADDVLDFNVRFEVQFIPRAVGFVGYRLLDFDRDEGEDDEIVENVQLGLRFAF